MLIFEWATVPRARPVAGQEQGARNGGPEGVSGSMDRERACGRVMGALTLRLEGLRIVQMEKGAR